VTGTTTEIPNQGEGEETQSDKPLVVPRSVEKLITARQRILTEQADRTDFLHTVMCQVGMPRRMTDARTFERHNGHMSILLEAGKLYNGKDWVEQPLPYGTTPRLIMVHLSSEAIRTQSRKVEIGDSMRQFLLTLGMGDGGGPRGGYTMVRRQVEALAACRLSIGMQAQGKVVTPPPERNNAYQYAPPRRIQKFRSRPRPTSADLHALHKRQPVKSRSCRFCSTADGGLNATPSRVSRYEINGRGWGIREFLPLLRLQNGAHLVVAQLGPPRLRKKLFRWSAVLRLAA
jgi:hypothetical protein